ncbi:MAG: hypothetical protein HY744_25785 [Deltaproteobacteria bacterium]|nr:hypothetical protein [Deltaproteobacteria bacterium]
MPEPPDAGRDDFPVSMLGDAGEQLGDILSVIEDLRRQLKNCKQINAALRPELEAAQRRAGDAQLRIDELERERERTNRRLAVCQAENETLVAEAVRVLEERQEVTRETQSMRQEQQAAQEMLRTLSLENERLTDAYLEFTEESSARDEAARKRIAEIEQTVEQQAGRLEEQGRELHRATVALADLAREKEELETEVANLERFRQAMNKLHGALRAPADKA